MAGHRVSQQNITQTSPTPSLPQVKPHNAKERVIHQTRGPIHWSICTPADLLLDQSWQASLGWPWPCRFFTMFHLWATLDHAITSVSFLKSLESLNLPIASNTPTSRTANFPFSRLSVQVRAEMSYMSVLKQTAAAAQTPFGQSYDRHFSFYFHETAGLVIWISFLETLQVENKRSRTK